MNRKYQTDKQGKKKNKRVLQATAIEKSLLLILYMTDGFFYEKTFLLGLNGKIQILVIVMINFEPFSCLLKMN